MLFHLLEVSLRSLLVAIPAAFVLYLPGTRRTAAFEHAICTAVVCGMLALFAFARVTPRLTLRILDRPADVSSSDHPVNIAGTATPSERAELLPSSPAVPTLTHRGIDWSTIFVGLYVAIAGALAVRMLAGMFLVRRLLAGAQPVDACSVTPLYESASVAVPLTLGWLRPKIVLPVEWREWSREKLDAVLAHEGAHVRRRDGLVALLAESNRCLFWFHPLAWLFQRKLSLLAEQACDESSVATLGHREQYVRVLLEMASVVNGSYGGRLWCHALTMAAPSRISQRIERLLEEGRAFSRGLSWRALGTLVLCAVPAVVMAAAIDLDRQPAQLRLDLPAWNPPPAPALFETPSAREPALLAQVQAQTLRVDIPSVAKFDTVSIRPCDSNHPAWRHPEMGGRSGSSPGKVWFDCTSAASLVERYLRWGDRLPLEMRARLLGARPGTLAREFVRGAPDWFFSELYTIQAATADPIANEPPPSPGTARAYGRSGVGGTPRQSTADDARPPAASSEANRIMYGPMLLAVLENRFQLKTHLEKEKATAYELTVADGGIQFKQTEAGSCDTAGKPMANSIYNENGRPLCGANIWSGTGSTEMMKAAGITMDTFIMGLSQVVRSQVVDKTGLAGVFDFYMTYPWQGPDISTSSSVLEALEQQLGLKLKPITGSKEVMVIDQIERPSVY